MATTHTLTLYEIGNALYRAGLLAEYEALKGYAIERSELLSAKPTTPELEDQCYEDACIEAAELVGPNSHENEGLVESISERLYAAHSASFVG